MSICRAPGRTSGWPGRRTSCPTLIGRSRTWKAWLLGTHRGVGADHLQVYLDEFVFAGTAGATPWPASRRYSGLGPAASPRPTWRSSGRSRPPARHGGQVARPGSPGSSDLWQDDAPRPDRFGASWISKSVLLHRP